MKSKIKLGNLLLSKNIITNEQLELALADQKQSGDKIGDVLVKLGFINEETLSTFIAQQVKIPYLELKWYRLKPEVIRELPEYTARRCLAMPIDRVKGEFLVVISDPSDISAVDEVRKALKKPLRLVAAKRQDILSAIDNTYRKTEEIANLVDQFEEDANPFPINETDNEEDNDVPIIKLLNSIFEDALQMHASDIHIEPDGDHLRIRQRIDGVLQEQVLKGKHIVSAIVLRLKLVAKLNISEKRLPQDGRFSLKIKGRMVDFRISTMPVKDGESVVLRILDQSQTRLSIDDLGMPSHISDRFYQHLNHPYGMIIVTGPTGSGKTTTLYAGLSILNSSERKIITVEDPVEYAFERINQVQVNPAIGLSFSSVLRSALRQDPDVVMVGEMRDEETAAIGMRAAMTGHLVLSTLHTNNALATPNRLFDMGVEPFLVASALRLIISQRLLRKICLSCQETYPLSEAEHAFINQWGVADINSVDFKKGRGCMRCRKTGYRGRIGVYEMIDITQPMSEALRSSDMQQFNEMAKADNRYESLVSRAIKLAAQGVTTLDEVFRVAGEND